MITKSKRLLVALLFTLATWNTALAEEYKFDIEGMHAFVQVKISHLGYSWMVGRFNNFDGTFSYDEKTGEISNVNATIDTTSFDSNHAERDKHIKGEQFLNAYKYPEATFKSKSLMKMGSKTILSGDFTLMGKTQTIALNLTEVGSGPDPWGGFRRGFEGTGKLQLMTYNFPLRPGTQTYVEIYVSIEGVRK